MGKLVRDETAIEIVEQLKQINKNISGEGGSIVYGFHINGNDSNPDTAVSYLRDAIGLEPAYMDYTNDVFNYGGWEDAFFMPKPCMLNNDGTVAYYLNPNDYSLKEDGTESDISNTSFAGNAMMEWGKNGRKIWYKVIPDASSPNSARVYIADHKEDDDYHCWSFINSEGNMIDHFYTPIYNGSNISSKLRSLSGQTPIYNQNASTEITYAKNNYNESDQIWNTEVLCDIQLINYLLILIGRSLNTQKTFGNGHYTGGSSVSDLLQTGTMNDKGLFYGTNGTGSGVKVFGMENFWGNQWRRFAGLINDNGNIKYKLCYGKSDGSDTDAYNLTGENYISSGITPSGTSGGYINKMRYTSDGVMLPEVSSGSDTTYYCDGLWFNNSQVDYAYRGGDCSDGFRVGSFCVDLDGAASGAYWCIGASPSCKPLI